MGEQYEFLTDVEKDIEKEIKATEVESGEIARELVNWIYGDIIKINKVRYSANKQNYPFTQKLDDVIVKGKEEELSLNIITPLNSQEYDEERLLHKSYAESGLILALPNSYEFVQDLELWVKTNKYIPQKQGGNLSDNERNLLYNKSSDNNKRREKLQNDLKEFIGEAKLYYNGKALDIQTKDVKTKIEQAFEEVIESTYSHISMLPRVYEERDIAIILNQSDDLLTGSDDALNPAEREIYTYIERQKNAHKSTTISDLLEYFKKRPYGWYPNAILALIASMYMKQKIDLKQNATPLNKQEVQTALTNTRQHHTLVVPKAIIDESKVRKTKEILSELYPSASFNSTSTRDIYDVAMQETRSLITTCQNFMNLGYPFNDALQSIIDTLSPIEKLTTETLFDEIPKMEDELLDTKEDLIEPLMEFMHGEKRKIYDSIVHFVKENQNNLHYIDDEQKEVLISLVKLKNPYRGNHIQKAKQALEAIKKMLDPLIEAARKEATAKIEKVIKALQENEGFKQVKESDRYKVIRPRQKLIEEIGSINSIDTIKQRSSDEALAKEYEDGIETIAELANIPETVKSVRLSEITPKEKIALKSKEEVEEYLTKMREKMLQALDEGKEILL